MTTIHYNTAAFLVLFATFIAGSLLAKWAARRLPESQQAELAKFGSDGIAMAAIVCAAGLGYLSPQLHFWSIVGSAACGVVAFVRIPLRFYRQPWAFGPRVLLVLANSILILGAVLFAGLRTIPFLKPTE